MSSDTLEYWYGITPKDLKAMSDNASKREIHRLAIASDGVNNPIEAKFCNGDPILTIHPDGRITASDELKPDETAAMVLQMVKEQWLKDPQAKKIRELQERIKRLEEAGDAIVDHNIGCGCGQDGPCRACRMACEAWNKAKEAKP